MQIRTTPIIASAILAIFVLGSSASADAPLKESLDLSMDQAKQVDEIQAKYRKEFRSKRGELKREERAMRRAKIDNDRPTLEKQEQVVAELRVELKAIRDAENDEVREVLTDEQSKKFDEVLAQRKAAKGSSRDEGEF